MLAASTWSSLIIKVNGSRELDNRFKNRLQGESRAFVGLALLLCSKSFDDRKLIFRWLYLELFFGFEWLCLDDRWSRFDALSTSSTLVRRLTRFQVSCADISPSDSHFSEERSDGDIDSFEVLTTYFSADVAVWRKQQKKLKPFRNCAI